MFGAELVNDPGCNVMCLNLNDRDISWAGDRPSVSGVPLRYFHFLLAFDPRRPEQLCDERFADAWLPYLSERPGAMRLAAEYAEQLLRHGYLQTLGHAQHYERLPDGTVVDRHMRSGYRAGVLRAEQGEAPLPPNPFDGETVESFIAYLLTPDEHGLSPYVTAIRRLRADLTAFFPRVPGEETERYLRWIDAERSSDWARAYAPLLAVS
jgi:hypothetical protein